MNSKLLLCPSLAVLSAIAGTVHAQDVAGGATAAAPDGTGAGTAPGRRGSPEPNVSPDNGGIRDIIVTAQRRSESLQRTSVVLDVISADTLARNGITQVEELTRISPSAQIGVAGPTVQVYIRGVGDFGATANSNPSVALNVDGVNVGRSQSIGSEFYDVERVEILKGPQGTLYGRNASGGALNILTRKPVIGKYSGDLSGEYGSFNSTTVEGGVNIPIGRTLAARISGIYVNKGGFTTEHYGDDKHHSGRVKLLWQPSSTVSLLVDASAGHVGGKGPADVIVNHVPGLGPWTDATDPRIRPFLTANIAATLPPIPGLIDNPRPNEGFLDLDFKNLSAQLEADLGFATLTVLPAYRHATMRYTSVSFVRYQVGEGFGDLPDRPETSKQTSLEVRLGHDSEQLKWVLGGYFYNEDQFSQFLSRQGLLSSNGEAYTLGTRSYAGFGQATYSVTPTIRAIGGLRYTSDRRETAGILVTVAPALSCPLPPGSTCPVDDYAGRKTFRNLSYKVGFEADIAPQSLLFGTVSTGFKAGGFNRTTDPNAAPGTNAALQYQPEKLTAFELGLKNRFLDNRLQLNVEGFYWNYLNHQEATVLITGRGNPSLNIVNAGKARMFGGSVDILARPWRNGTFNAAVEYDNSKFKDFLTYRPAAFVFPGATGCALSPSTQPPNPRYGPILVRDCSGFQLTRAPTWVGSAGYTQVFPLGNAGSLEANGSLQFASRRWIAPDFNPIEHVPAYTTLNASLTYSSLNRGVSVTGYVRNITNQAVYQGGFQAPFQPTVAVATISPPRNYGVRLGLKF